MDGKESMVIVLQDNPDPDALGAAVGLRKLANTLSDIPCSIVAGGAVGRAENRALIRYLQLNLRPFEAIDLDRFGLVAMVDTQPGQGNNSLPEDAMPDVVIDHHPTQKETRKVGFTDVRSRYGSTCTILSEYLREAKIQPDTPTATALLYGIRSDTQDFGRESTQSDLDEYGRLYALANKRMLGDIQRGVVPSEYFKVLVAAMENARLHGSCIHTELGEVENVDMIPEVSDLLLRHEKADWSLCWGRKGERVLLSMRTNSPGLRADQAMKKIVSRKGTGGGHYTMAGGQIPLKESTQKYLKRLRALILRRFHKAADCEDEADEKIV